MRQRSWVPLLFLTAILIVACSSENPAVPPGGTLTGDPNDPIVCVGDPDSTVVCKKESEFWDCHSMPNGDVKCKHLEPQVPDGTNAWTCTQVEDKLVCKTETKDVPGGGGWNCTSDEFGSTCEKDAPVPPGGGTYTCSFDSELVWSCEGDGTNPPPTTPPTTPPTNPPANPPAPPSNLATICYDVVPGTTGVKPPEGMWAKLVTSKVLYNGVPAVYVRLTLSKGYVDNTYGAYAVEYDGAGVIGKHHSFGDLLESDKNEFFIADGKGDLIMDFNMDYISNSSTHPSGYGCLGATGGDGNMIKGDAAAILGAQTSLSVNFNAHGYVLTQDSPVTDVNYTPDPQYPNWIFEAWYEFWVKIDAFGAAGPGRIYITGLHASPNKLNIKPLPLTPGECPP